MTKLNRMGRKPLDPQEKRDKQVAFYVTGQEEVAANLLGTDYGYMGTSDAIRRAMAFFIAAKHPKLLPYLRNDLKETVSQTKE